MLVLEHLFLCAASILSCLTALRWIGTPKRRCLLLSVIQGALNLCVGICGAYFLADRYSGALSLLVLIFYLPIALNSLAHATFQSIAAVSIACAGMGCLQAATGFLLDWTAIPFLPRGFDGAGAGGMRPFMALDVPLVSGDPMAGSV